MPLPTQATLQLEKRLHHSGACAPDGRPLAQQLFFEADNWLVPEHYDDLLARHAAYLAAHPTLVGVISGHSNGAGLGSHRFFWLMGDRRALAVRSALIKGGAAPAQVVVESRGAAQAGIEPRGEDAAQFRRRVAITYLDRDSITAPPVAPEGSARWWRSVLGSGRASHKAAGRLAAGGT